MMRVVRGLSVAMLLMISLAACGVDVRRNTDGTLRLETVIQEPAIQNAINAILVETEIRNLAMDLRQGYIHVTGDYVNGGAPQPLSFRLTLSAVKGNLVAEITEALINAKPIEATRVEEWNAAIAARLVDANVHHPGTTLETAVITPEKVSLIWRVQTAASAQ